MSAATSTGLSPAAIVSGDSNASSDSSCSLPEHETVEDSESPSTSLLGTLGSHVPTGTSAS